MYVCELSFFVNGVDESRAVGFGWIFLLLLFFDAGDGRSFAFTWWALELERGGCWCGKGAEGHLEASVGEREFCLLHFQDLDTTLLIRANWRFGHLDGVFCIEMKSCDRDQLKTFPFYEFLSESMRDILVGISTE